MSIHATLRYDDPRAAITFLTSALGFESTEVAEDGDEIVHAELTWPAGGDGDVLMLGKRRTDDSFDTGRAVLYLAVAPGVEVDPLHATAVAAGAPVVMELTDQPYGSREFAVADPEGNVWSVGTYRP